MIRKSSILVLLLAAILAVGCKSRKVAGEASGVTATQVDFIKSMSAFEGVTDALSAKARFTLDAGGKNFSSSGTLKVQENSGVQLVISPLSIFEVARLEFTPTTATFINRVGKEYSTVDYATVPLLANAGISYPMLESLFLGKIYFPAGKSLADIKVSSSADEIELSFDDNDISYSYTLSPSTGLLLKSSGRHKYGTEFTATYGNYQSADGLQLPARILLSLNSTAVKATLLFELSQMRAEASFSPTKPSSSYKKKNVSDIIKSLGI